LINVDAQWWKVEVLTVYQLVTAEMQIRGRLSSQLNDPEPFVKVRNIETLPLLPGAPKLAGIPEGTLNKNYFCAIRTIEVEPPPPDTTMENITRFCYFQGTGFTAKGQAEFPSAADPSMHQEMLFKGHFFKLVDATLSMVGADVAPLVRPEFYINRELMIALYLR